MKMVEVAADVEVAGGSVAEVDHRSCDRKIAAVGNRDYSN